MQRLPNQNNANLTVGTNYKGKLLETASSYFGVDSPEYFHFEYGPHHAKVFLCFCAFKNQIQMAEGRTKVEAEQTSSQLMLDKIREGSIALDGEHPRIEQQDDRMLHVQLQSDLTTLKTQRRYEVLSLYGDAVLRCKIACYAFHRYPLFHEGLLTRILSEALREESRATVARLIKLESWLQGTPTQRNLAEGLSALLGQISQTDEKKSEMIIERYYQLFVDQAALTILRNQHLDNALDQQNYHVTRIHNFKTECLEYISRRRYSDTEELTFKLIQKEGPDHAPSFTVECHFKEWVTYGSAKTIKSAEQAASAELLKQLKAQEVASVRHIPLSSSFSAKAGQVKRFKAPELKALKKTIRWPYFETLEDLEAVFTHASKNPEVNYQRLEFLGDALLKKYLLQAILEKHPDLNNKAQLSRDIDHLVSAGTQERIAKQFGLDKYLFTAVQPSNKMLGDILEALIAAIMLDAEQQVIKPGRLKRDPSITVVRWFDKELRLIFGPPMLRGKSGDSSSPFQASSSLKVKAQCDVNLSGKSIRFFDKQEKRVQNVTKVCKEMHELRADIPYQGKSESSTEQTNQNVTIRS